MTQPNNPALNEALQNSLAALKMIEGSFFEGSPEQRAIETALHSIEESSALQRETVGEADGVGSVEAEWDGYQVYSNDHFQYKMVRLAFAKRLESDLTATREKLAEAERVNHELGMKFHAAVEMANERANAIFSLRAQNVALEAQVTKLREIVSWAVQDFDEGMPANPRVEGPNLHIECEHVLIEGGWVDEARAALSRTPSTALGEIREKVKDILDVVSEEMQPCENEGVPNYPDILDDVHAKLTQLLTTLTGEKK